MAKLRAEFEADREQVGVIKLFSGAGSLVTFYSALGKAAANDAVTHHNPHASPLLPYGDTPVGTYEVLGIFPSGPGTRYNSHSYGDVGVIRLNPVSGEALLAKHNGRTGLLVHGGAPGAHAILRRTNGCIRMMNAELRDLISRLATLGENLHTLEVAEVGGVGTGVCDDNGVCGDQDPPPG